MAWNPMLLSSPTGELRICGDYKVAVNKVSKLEQYPITSLEDLMTKLSGGSVYHKLDLSHAYAQIELEQESRKFVTVTRVDFTSIHGYHLVYQVHRQCFSTLWTPCSRRMLTLGHSLTTFS